MYTNTSLQWIMRNTRITCHEWIHYPRSFSCTSNRGWKSSGRYHDYHAIVDFPPSIYRRNYAQWNTAITFIGYTVGVTYMYIYMHVIRIFRVNSLLESQTDSRLLLTRNKRYIHAIVVLYNYGEIDFTSGTREVEYSNPELWYQFHLSLQTLPFTPVPLADGN